MTGASFERALAAHDPDDAHREPERGACALQDRPLFDVHLQEAFGELLALREGRAPDATTLLVAEDHDDAAARALNRLDRRDDAERTVELASVRDGVEMGAGPDARVGAAPDQVAGAVHFDREACLLQPLRGEFVCAVLPRGTGDAVRADAAADGVELVEPLVDPHRAIIPPGRDARSHGPVSDMVTGGDAAR